MLQSERADSGSPVAARNPDSESALSSSHTGKLQSRIHTALALRPPALAAAQDRIPELMVQWPCKSYMPVFLAAGAAIASRRACLGSLPAPAEQKTKRGLPGLALGPGDGAAREERGGGGEKTLSKNSFFSCRLAPCESGKRGGIADLSFFPKPCTGVQFEPQP